MSKKMMSNPILYLLFLSSLFLFQGCSTSPQERLEQIAEETRKACPVIIDEYTVMQNAEALPGLTLKFTYSLKGTFGEGIKQEITDAMKPVLLEKLRQRDEDLEFYRDNDVRFEHLFQDSQGLTVAHVVIQPADYK